MKMSRALGEPMERLELEADVRNRSGRDGQIVAFRPGRSVVQHDRAPEWPGHLADHFAADQRTSDAAREGLGGGEGRRIAPSLAVVFGEKSVHHPGAEEKPVARFAVSVVRD